MGFQISNVNPNVDVDDPAHPWPRLARVELDPFSELQLKRTLALFAREPKKTHAQEEAEKAAKQAISKMRMDLDVRLDTGEDPTEDEMEDEEEAPRVGEEARLHMLNWRYEVHVDKQNGWKPKEKVPKWNFDTWEVLKEAVKVCQELCPGYAVPAPSMDPRIKDPYLDPNPNRNPNRNPNPNKGPLPGPCRGARSIQRLTGEEATFRGADEEPTRYPQETGREQLGRGHTAPSTPSAQGPQQTL